LVLHRDNPHRSDAGHFLILGEAPVHTTKAGRFRAHDANYRSVGVRNGVEPPLVGGVEKFGASRPLLLGDFTCVGKSWFGAVAYIDRLNPGLRVSITLRLEPLHDPNRE
jgi:hypothetical protein